MQGRLRRLALVPLLAAPLVMLVSAPPADALAGPVAPPAPTVPDQITPADESAMPAVVIAQVLGQVAPTSAAQAATTYQLNYNAQHGSTVAAGIQNGVKIADYVPGFQLGFKLGGWFANSLGLSGSSSSSLGATPCTCYTPYSGESVNSPQGWTPGTNTFAVTWNGTAAAAQYYTSAPAFTVGASSTGQFASYKVAGASIAPTASLSGNCVNGSANGGCQVGRTYNYLAIFDVLKTTDGYVFPAQVANLGISPSTTVTANGATSPLTLNSGCSGCYAPGYPPTTGATNTNPQHAIAGSTVIGVLATTTQGYATCYDGSKSCAVNYSYSPALPTGLPSCLSTLDLSSLGSLYKVQGYYCATDIPGAPAASPAAPTREWANTSSCTATSGGAVTKTSTYSLPFKETDSTFPQYPTGSTCAAGSFLTGWSIDLVDPSTLGVIKNVDSWTAPSAYTSTITGQPLCASQQCYTVLWKAGTSGTGWQNCFSLQDACQAWAADANRTSDYKCTYGPTQTVAGDTDVGLSGCYHYGPTFDLSARQKGVIYSDPSTDPALAPGGEGVGNPAETVTGTIANQPDPNSGLTSTTPDTGSCWPSGFPTSITSLLGYIYKPFECALKWAFVPNSTEVTAQMSATWNTISTRPPVSLVTAVYPAIAGFTSGVLGGCQGKLADFGSGLVVPCTVPGNPAWFQALYLLGECMICGLTAFGCWRFVEEGIGDR